MINMTVPHRDTVAVPLMLQPQRETPKCSLLSGGHLGRLGSLQQARPAATHRAHCARAARAASPHEQDALLEVLGHAQRERAPVQGLAVVDDLDVAPAEQASPYKTVCNRMSCNPALVAASALCSDHMMMKMA